MLHTVSCPAEAALPPAPARSPLRFTRCRAWWARWLLALAIWCVAASVRWLLDDIVVSGPFLTFLPAIALTTVFCGRQPAVAVIALGAAACTYLWLPTTGLTPESMASVVSLSAGALLANLVSVVLLVTETVSYRSR